MKTLLRYICILFLLCSGGAASAQTMTLVLSDMQRTSGVQWKYGTVTCTGTNNVTSIIFSMINNNIASNSSGITPTRTLTSSGTNPRTILYLFTSGLTPAQVATFIKGITFTQTNDVNGANPYVNISVDANPTSLPPGAPTITVWNHPDGSPHYYVWVNTNSYIGYMQAYNAAKTYYFQGMRGYLPTITSVAENSLLTNISNLGGWSGGARTTSNFGDAISTSINPVVAGNDFKWLCGPETNFYYYRGPTWSTAGAGPMNGAYSGWPPGGGQPDASGGENSMQINFSGYWNDLHAPQGSYGTNVLTGYFIEFGGNGSAYSVGSANYPANPAYYRPTAPTTNAQWQGYSPGNTASTSTTFKPNSMRANVLVVE